MIQLIKMRTSKIVKKSWTTRTYSRYVLVVRVVMKVVL